MSERNFIADFPLTRHEAVHWWKRWNDDDRRRAEQEIDRLGCTEFFRQPAGITVLCVREGEPSASIWLTAGRISFPEGKQPHDAYPRPADPGIWSINLSRHEEHGKRSVTEREAPEPVCKTCFTVLPKSGQCDYCE